MAGAFLLTSAPSGASWEQELNKAPPALDGNGFVTGAWGECIHYAVVFENLDSGWKQIPDFSEDGPVGQVVNFAIAKGFSGFEEALNKTEDATKAAQANGNNGFVFQQQQQSSQPQPAIMGMSQVAPAPIQQMMVPPAQQTMMVQVPPGSGPGSLIQVATPNGQQVQVTVPQGVGPGQQFAIAIPGAGGGLQQVDPFQMLASLQMIKIEEKMNMMETASGLIGDLLGVDMTLEMNNKYIIRSPEGHPLFFAVENSDFMNRQCGGDCRAIDIDVVVLGQDPELMKEVDGTEKFDWSMNPLKGGVDLSNSQKFIKLHKDFQCTCCCLNRPKIDVTNGVTNELIGQITDPWACCDMTFTLLDKSAQPALVAHGGCCQPGLICPCPCGPCKEVKFSVKDAKSKQDVGKLKKIVPDCLKFIVADDVDNYEVEFGQVSDPQWKAMLVALGLFIDFRYFNDRSDSTGGGMEMSFGDD